MMFFFSIKVKPLKCQKKDKQYMLLKKNKKSNIVTQKSELMALVRINGISFKEITEFE